MKTPRLEEVFNQLLSQNRPFVFYRLPKSKTVHCFFQEDQTLNSTPALKVEGFVMSRFDAPLPAVYISNKNHLEFDAPTQCHRAGIPSFQQEKSEKEAFTTLVQKTLKAIENGRLKKLVVARKINLQRTVDPVVLFSNLCALYSQAMVYFWYHPKAETWVGATPEQLFSVRSSRLTTMALAGTMTRNEKEEYQWGRKEVAEQKWVKDTLFAQLQDLFLSGSIQCSKTHTKSAGNLVHLCNELSVDFQNLALAEWVAKLHPTPAVGGIPLAEGMSFLQQNENLDRAYYAGFLGPVTTAGNTELFVNLRCAKISNGQISLYVGAGITKDSDPEQEWEETQNKAKTLWTALP